MRAKKDRHVMTTDLSLTPTTELKIGETFVVLRRVQQKDNVSEERCVATLVEIRDHENDDEASTSDEPVAKKVKYCGEELVYCCIEETVEYLIGEVCKVLNEDSGRQNAIVKKSKKLFYVHYDGMDRRLDEWVERERIVERAKPGAITPSILTVPPALASALEGTLTRSQRRIHEEFNHVQKSYADMDATTAKLEKEHAEMTKVKNIEVIRYGDYEVEAWYVSPYPEKYSKLRKLWICEYCMAYMKDEKEYICHMNHYCIRRQPPGDEIYRKGNLSVFEVDGKAYKAYCQCLCLLSKLFLDHKTLFYDVETFLFYVLCEVDQVGAHVVGHFSKERMSANNLACIMVLPPFQRKGYGKLLIQLSYELSAREGIIGTPEKPLSDLGKVSYRSYWWYVILGTLDSLDIDDITVADLSLYSGIAEDDIMSTLQTMQLIKYWKGDHVVRMTRRLVDYCRSINMGRPPKLRLDPQCLRWQPKSEKPPSRKESKLSGLYT